MVTVEFPSVVPETARLAALVSVGRGSSVGAAAGAVRSTCTTAGAESGDALPAASLASAVTPYDPSVPGSAAEAENVPVPLAVVVTGVMPVTWIVTVAFGSV